MANLKIEDETIYVQIDNDWRNIGVVRNRVLNVYRSRVKHLMRNFDAYGFNKDVVESDKYFDYVALQETYADEKNVYFIPREDILLDGKLYKAEEFEPQYFLSLSQLEQYRTED
jgi:hypothetical protein